MREEKQFLLDEVQEKIEKAKGFVVARYQNFSAAQSREFRDQMAEAGGEFEVVRKRVFVKAAENLGLKFELDKLEGHVGVVFAEEDALSVAKGVVNFGKDNDDAVSVLCGHIDGEHCTAEDVKMLARLPNLEQLRSQFLGLLEAPMGQTVGVMNSALSSVLYCLDEKSKK